MPGSELDPLWSAGLPMLAYLWFLYGLASVLASPLDERLLRMSLVAVCPLAQPVTNLFKSTVEFATLIVPATWLLLVVVQFTTAGDAMEWPIASTFDVALHTLRTAAWLTPSVLIYEWTIPLALLGLLFPMFALQALYRAIVVVDGQRTLGWPLALKVASKATAISHGIMACGLVAWLLTVA